MKVNFRCRPTTKAARCFDLLYQSNRRWALRQRRFKHGGARLSAPADEVIEWASLCRLGRLATGKLGRSSWSSVSSAMSQPNKFLCHRHLEGRRSVALKRGAAHVAHLARLLVAPGPMHGLAVVPHHEIMLPPGVGVDELSLGRVLGKIAH